MYDKFLGTSQQDARRESEQSDALSAPRVDESGDTRAANAGDPYA
jgi:hypothetical protein